MSSKLLKPGSELKGKRLGDATCQSGGHDRIAKVSEGPAGHAAPIRASRGYPRPSKDMTGKGFTQNHLESGQ